MPSKAGKITAGKARERIEGLRESIASRRHRLDQLRARLDRSDVPDDRLLTAKTRLERRLEQEQEQLEKLLRLLDRQEGESPEESADFEAEEEIEDLHRSFEEIRQNLVQLQSRIDSNPEVPRDLDGRLAACETRISRREAVDSELFARVMSLQTALDQERQAARRLARRFKDQEQSMEALREAVEDAVVTTVDLAERLEELAELSTPVDPSAAPPWFAEMQALRDAFAEANSSMESLRKQTGELSERAAAERAEIRQQQDRTAHSLQDVLTQSQTRPAEPSISPAESELRAALRSQSELYQQLLGRLDAFEHEQRRQQTVEGERAETARLSRLEGELARLVSREVVPAEPVASSHLVPASPTRPPAVFAPSSQRAQRPQAVFGKRFHRGN